MNELFVNHFHENGDKSENKNSFSKIKQNDKHNTKSHHELPKHHKLGNAERKVESDILKNIPKVPKIPKLQWIPKNSFRKPSVKKENKVVKLECCCKKQDGECVGSRHNKCCSQVINLNDVFTPAPSISLRHHRDSFRVPWFISERDLMS